MSPVHLHPDALQEAQTTVEWYEDKREGLGIEFLAELRRSVEAISANPRVAPLWPGAQAKAAGIHRFHMERFPFVLPYVVVGEQVTLLAIAHERRRPMYWQRRALAASHH
ncbi:hypothetical protein MYSTI_06623 [Myxococcus stipitatus DSM 14675]|uniref:Plasmid stabilization system protein n=1 Tax=Myxococcus stipitatus (strain DSM 14675 / JCM 12634 / Mx s8) TaxID=1278073 RepID=L7UFZ6_MYXSD|nr:type II toxin-antitoxin system RelE/ParE family toxin [Myxococcus stipitatus]AGC47896.1 hypothetical protein MYSTI_06623 [Myxococcus stipitatus DSM 14675]